MVVFRVAGTDPARAAGTSAFNMVSVVVGTEGAPDGLKDMGTAAGSRVGGRVDRRTRRGAEYIPKLPTPEDVVVDTARRLPGFHIPVPGTVGEALSSRGSALRHRREVRCRGVLRLLRVIRRPRTGLPAAAIA
jgi:hypothetical protein